MEGKKYQGWTNYETWVVNLWLTNYSGTYDAILESVRDNAADHDAGEAIKEFVEELNPLNDKEPSLFTDLMNGALSEVNWREIAQSLRETLKENEQYEGAR